MGGSGSTGSSVLQRILDRHTRMVAGPELGLFQFPFLYEKWDRYKHRLAQQNFFGIKSRAFARRNGAKLLHPYYGWNPSDLNRLLTEAPTFPDFVTLFFQRKLNRSGAEMFVEKTPQNAQGFSEFLKHFPQGRVVHTLRNPYETMASLRRRGFPAYVAAGHFVYQTAAAASARGHQRYTEVEYEQLVGRPTETVRELCAFLQLDFEPDMMRPDEAEQREAVKMPGWRAAETDAIRRVDLNKFSRLDERAQQEIIAALQVYQIPKTYLRKWDIRYRNFAELCSVMGFDHRITDVRPFIKQFQRERERDWLVRSFRFHPTGWWNYPGNLVI